MKVALIGNPNSGKSTLFNQLTGLNQKIANFPGVTVEKRTGQFSVVDQATNKKLQVLLTDLPGTYSVYPKTPEEKVTFEVLCDPANPDHPDKVIVIADGTNLKRSLFLASQVIDLKIPVILVINMMDLVRKSGIEIDLKSLAESLGVPVIPVTSLHGEGVEDVKKELTASHPLNEKDFIATIDYAPEVIIGIRQNLNITSDYAALQVANNFESIGFFNENTERLTYLRNLLGKFEFDAVRSQAAETLERYRNITALLNDVLRRRPDVSENNKEFTDRIDGILTHRVWGFLFFLFVMFVIFQAIYAWSSLPMDLVDTSFARLSEVVRNLLPAGILNDLIVNGILAGLGGVVIFIPQIGLLFLFIAILEDTGYMARVSFMLDRVLRKVGLNGRSVIPLISGVACAVPAIMATRTIKSWKDRIITIMVTPLMSCSARLPVYALLIAMVIPRETTMYGLLNLQGFVLMSLYLIGFFAALGFAWVMNIFIKQKERSYFIMEIPVYRVPRWKNILVTIFEKVKIFVTEAGKIIVAISIVLWALASYGPGDEFRAVSNLLEQAEANGDDELAAELGAEKLELSFAGITGKRIEPLIEPLGFDWKIGIALITSFAAREVFVGTMSTIYSVGTTDEEVSTVREKMMADRDEVTGRPRYDLATGWSLMLFYAFAMQCMSTLAVVKRETGVWKWPVLQFIFMGILAYLSSLTVYQFLK